jgi:hypothetical protein
LAAVGRPTSLEGIAARRRKSPAWGGDADVAGHVDALALADAGDQLAGLLQAERRVEAVPARRGPGVDRGAARRGGGQVELEHLGVVAAVGPLEANRP